MASRLKKLAAIVVIALILPACAQLAELYTFTKCQFKLDTVQNITLAGINVQNIHKFGDLSLLDAAKLGTAVASNNFPLTLTLNVQVKNPNSTQASLNKIDWIMLIDDIEMVQGIMDQRVVVPSGGTTTIPLHIATNLKKALKGQGGQSIINFGLNLAGASNKPTRFTLRTKPTVVVGTQTLEYPGYIDVKTEFTSN